METLDRLLTVEDLADYLGVPVTTLYQWRYRSEGPPGFRVGRYNPLPTGRRGSVDRTPAHQHHQLSVVGLNRYDRV